MNHDRYRDAIQELAEGTLGPLRRAELQQHLDECPACRRLADDVRRIRELAQSLDRPAPPDRVWLQVAGRLRQEGRIATPTPRAVVTRRFMPLAIAASLLLVIGASLYLLYPRSTAVAPQPDTHATAQQPSGNAAQMDAVQGVEAEFRLAEQHYQNAIAKLEEAAKSESGAIDPQTAAMLQKNLQVIDQAIAESRAALRSEPQSARARDSLFDALRKKVTVLQDTIALMNHMRMGDAAGAAQIVDAPNKS
ncbi:MAG: zf-HC2 domain-containing protein [Vicinamibacterales bacterium]